MKKDSLLLLLNSVRLQAEVEDADGCDILKVKVIDLLLDYINDQKIRESVEEIPL